MAISNVPGFGPKRLAQLQTLGIATWEDALRFFPAEYQDTTFLSTVAGVEPSKPVFLRLRLATQPRVMRLPGGRTMVSGAAEDATGRLQLYFFGQPYQAARLQMGQDYHFYGRAAQYKGKLTLVNPVFEQAENGSMGGILPVYRAKGLPQKMMRTLMEKALLESPVPDFLPAALRTRFGLAGRGEAYRHIHFPESRQTLAAARARFAFEELLFFRLQLYRHAKKQKEPAPVWAGLSIEEFEANLPFPLTGAQRRAIGDIAKDLQSGWCLNRLLQGDVGSGKTFVAYFALWAAWKNGKQAAYMAPTDVLARQHFEEFTRLFPCIKTGYLSGAVKKKEKEERKTALLSGELDCVMGTHALLEEDVSFARLAMAVADEQHRFGVSHRASLLEKAETGHMLVMSATPIPRTLSLVLFKDLPASVIDEMPPGRQPVSTHIVPAAREEALYQYIAEEAAAGKQSYLVCPLIEESEELDILSAEDLFSRLQKGALKGTSVALLHGRQPAAQKTEIMRAFYAGETQVLVSTTVIEVGVNVPAAVNMVIHSAARFGLAQLHQLRGRVGRGTQKSYCFLLPGSAGKEAMERLQILTETQNGFEIAEKDLRLRGPGDYIGSRQSGLPGAGKNAAFSDYDMLAATEKVMDALLSEKEYEKNKEAIFALLDKEEAKNSAVVMN